MTYKRLFPIIVSLAIFSSGALAVEPSKPTLALFNDVGWYVDMRGLDISVTPGVEALGFNWSFGQVVDPDDGTRRIARQKGRIQTFRTSDDVKLATFNYREETYSYPDPATAVQTAYFCADDIEDLDYYQVNASAGLACDWTGSGGIANAGADQQQAGQRDSK